MADAPPPAGQPDPGDERPDHVEPEHEYEPTWCDRCAAASSEGLPGEPEPSDEPTNEELAAELDAMAGDEFGRRQWVALTLAAARLRAAPPSPGPDGRRLADGLGAAREAIRDLVGWIEEVDHDPSTTDGPVEVFDANSYVGSERAQAAVHAALVTDRSGK